MKNLKKNYTNVLLYETDLENEFMVARGKDRRKG